jgi:hypothetical protein
MKAMEVSIGIRRKLINKIEHVASRSQSVKMLKAKSPEDGPGVWLKLKLDWPIRIYLGVIKSWLNHMMFVSSPRRPVAVSRHSRPQSGKSTDYLNRYY